MANRTLYLPDELLERLDARIAEGPDFNHGRGSFAGVVKLAIERYLGDQPQTVKDVFREAVGPGVSRADAFHRATQR